MQMHLCVYVYMCFICNYLYLFFTPPLPFSTDTFLSSTLILVTHTYIRSFNTFINSYSLPSFAFSTLFSTFPSIPLFAIICASLKISLFASLFIHFLTSFLFRFFSLHYSSARFLLPFVNYAHKFNAIQFSITFFLYQFGEFQIPLSRLLCLSLFFAHNS